MKFEKIEDIVVWRKSNDFGVEIYMIFKNCRDYGFKDQIQRAAVSISNNIAEGFERKSNKEFVRFLFIAKGSCGEVHSMAYLADRLGYIDKATFDKILLNTCEVSKMLYGLIRTIQ